MRNHSSVVEGSKPERFTVITQSARNVVETRTCCQDSSVVRFLLIDPMVIGSNPPPLELPLRVRRVAALCNYRRRNHEVWSHREKGSERLSMSKKLLNVH